MKSIYFILPILIGIQFSCTKTEKNDNDQNSLLSKWKLIEWYSSDGGEGSWQTIEDGFYYQFNENNTVESDLYNCIGSYSIHDNMEFNLFISFQCETSQVQGHHKIIFEGDYLLLWSDCDEGCGGKFKRINSE